MTTIPDLTYLREGDRYLLFLSMHRIGPDLLGGAVLETHYQNYHHEILGLKMLSVISEELDTLWDSSGTRSEAPYSWVTSSSFKIFQLCLPVPHSNASAVTSQEHETIICINWPQICCFSLNMCSNNCVL